MQPNSKAKKGYSNLATKDLKKKEMKFNYKKVSSNNRLIDNEIGNLLH